MYNNAKESQVRRKRRLHNPSNGNKKDEKAARPSSCTYIRVARTMLVVSGLASIAWTQNHFHTIFQSRNNHDLMADFKEEFSKIRPRFSLKKSKGATTQTQARGESAGRSPFHGLMTTYNQQHQQQQQGQQIQRLVLNNKPEYHEPTIWGMPASSEFDPDITRQKLSQWRQARTEVFMQEQDEQLLLAAQKPGDHSAKIIPFLHETPIFRQSLSYNLMVFVMADPECPLEFPDPKGIPLNATQRLLLTLNDALQTRHASVVAYLPNYSSKEQCHNTLFQAVVQTFQQPLKTGQLQVISPPLQQYRGPAYKFAQHGLDFAYAAELGYELSDLCLFLQAGTRLLNDWWLRYVPVPEGEQGGNPVWDDATNSTVFMKPEEATKERDYGMEIMRAYESRLQYDESGQSHDLCYMNFARGVKFQNVRYAALERPTGSLFASSDLLRFSLLLRSYLPYGKFSVSQLLERYCSGLLWESDAPNAALRMFRYTIKANENKVSSSLRADGSSNISEGMTFPFLVPSLSEVPSWVKVNASMIGPRSALEQNPFISAKGSIPTAAVQDPHIKPPREKVWMTFVIPTAWRPLTSDGNGYVVECLRQLTTIIKEHFKGAYKAKILLVITGQTENDLTRHYRGLEARFSADIESGLIELVRAPLEQFPTLHGLNIHFKDTESRVRWRSKQNLDMSAAFFAAKGHGKYVMIIEDDSGFRPNKFFTAIRQTLSNLVGVAVTNNNAAELPMQVLTNAKGSNTTFYDTLTTTGHLEHWSQVRFAFGYSGVLVHDEDVLVYGMLHFLLYQEKPCDLMENVADSVRGGVTKDHFLRWNMKLRSITHLGKISTLSGKVYDDKDIVK